MDAETLEALKGSIRKWVDIVAGTRTNQGSSDCPLCLLFNTVSTNPCIGCPVSDRTSKAFCNGTPYLRYVTFRPRERKSPEGIKAAQDELDFLRSLLPEGQ